MAQHLSVRIPWKDNGYSGLICEKPCRNTACLRLKGIAENKDDTFEDSIAGKPIKGHEGKIPCLAEGGAFMSKTPHTKITSHPYKKNGAKSHSHFLDTDVVYPPFSFPARPFGWMMLQKNEDAKHIDTIAARYLINFIEDDEPKLGFQPNWVQTASNQRAIFKAFYRHVIPNKSLAIPYAKQVPFIEDSKRIVMGLGYISKVVESADYKTSDPKQLQSITWETMLEHTIRNDRKNGFLFPYKEMMAYAQQNPDFDIRSITVFADDDYFEEFSYATEHVSYDAVISVLRQSIKALQIIKGCGIAGNWDECIDWAKACLENVWEDRGVFPGVGAMLIAMGIPCGEVIAHEIKSFVLPEENYVDVFEKVISKPEDYFSSELMEAIKKTSVAKTFVGLKNERKSLFWLLSRCSLTPAQANYLFNDRQGQDDSEILANPYRIYEITRTLEVQLRVSLQKIDMALFPPTYLADKYPLPKISALQADNDERRIRAFFISLLEGHAEAGHTVYPESLLIKELGSLPISPTCTVTVDLLNVCRDFLSEELVPIGMTLGGNAYQLYRLFKFDEEIRRTIKKRVERAKRHKVDEDWRSLVEAAYQAHELTEVQKQARQEQTAILQELAEARLSVLVGCAGTGKTTLLSLLCSSQEIQNGGILLLAPTGKARVRMVQAMQSRELNFEAQTVAQFLLRNNRFNYATMQYQLSSSETKNAAKTVIIDESSMLTEEMFGALLQALKNAGRIIFVGDPNQLPPIGAGRPFVDLVTNLRKDVPPFPRVGKSYGELTVIHRQQRDEAGKQIGIMLAECFTDSDAEREEDTFSALQSNEYSSKIAFKQWGTVEELEGRILETLVEEIGLSDIDDMDGFDFSLGGEVNNNVWMNFGNNIGEVESWQILSAYRNNTELGTAPINRLIHNQFRTNASAKSDYKKRGTRHPLGNDGIIFGDKVINVRNQKQFGYPKDCCLNYVANGEVGIVERIWQKPKDKKNTHQIRFNSQPEFSYNWPSKVSDEGSTDLELAYALTVHKAQGSEFKKVILIIGKNMALNSRELLYTAITRQVDKLIILYNDEAYKLREYTSRIHSDVAKRFTALFQPPNIVEHQKRFYEANLIHKTERGELVRSKSEVIIANALHSKGISYEYEKALCLEGETPKYPDFTIDDAESGVTYYWEHCGMMHDASYRKRWEEKKKTYEKHDIIEDENLIVTYEDSHGFDSQKIAEIIDNFLL